MQQFKAEYLQDIAQVANNADFEMAIFCIPGQRSGISLQYFWMLAGSDELVKPDRMIIRFLKTALNREVQIQEALPLLRAATLVLSTEYPQMTPRLLDYAIWQYQRQSKSDADVGGGHSEYEQLNG